MSMTNDPVVVIPEIEPMHQQGSPLDLNYKVVFAPCNVRNLGEKKDDIPRDGKYHRMSVLTGSSGNNKNNKFDKLFYFDCGELEWDSEEQRMADDSIDDMMTRLEQSLLVLANEIDSNIASNQRSSLMPTTSQQPGSVTIDLAAYHPFPEMAIAWCEIFDAPWYQGVQEFEFIRDYAKSNLSPIIERFKKDGWTFNVEYVGFLDIVGIRRETVEEEKQRRLEEERMKVEMIEKYEAEQRRIAQARARAKAEGERLNRAATIVTWVGIGFSAFAIAAGVVIATVACPPAGIAMGAAAIGTIGGAGFVAASVTIHVKQMQWEEVYLGEVDWVSHGMGILTDLVSIVPWGYVAKGLGASVKLASTIGDVTGYALLATTAGKGAYDTKQGNEDDFSTKPYIMEYKPYDGPNQNESGEANPHITKL